MSLAERKLTLLHINNKEANQPVNSRSLISAGKHEACMSATYEGCSESSDHFPRSSVQRHFERHSMHLSRELSFSFKSMLISSLYCFVD